MQMVGGTVGGIVSHLTTKAFGVVNTDFSRLWQLTVLTSCARLVSLLFLPLIPRSAAAIVGASESGKRSVGAGVLVTSLFVGGIVFRCRDRISCVNVSKHASATRFEAVDALLASVWRRRSDG